MAVMGTGRRSGMADNRESVRGRTGVRRLEIIGYLAIDASAATWSFMLALSHGWSPYLFLLIIAVPAAILGVGMVISLLMIGRARG